VRLGGPMIDRGAASLVDADAELIPWGSFPREAWTKSLAGKNDLVKVVLFQFDCVGLAKTLGADRVLEVGVQQLVGVDDILGGYRLFLVTGRAACLQKASQRQHERDGQKRFDGHEIPSRTARSNGLPNRQS